MKNIRNAHEYADITRFAALISKWKDPKITGDLNKLNSLADETIQAVNSEPLLKNICEVFLFAVSTKCVTQGSRPLHGKEKA